MNTTDSLVNLGANAQRITVPVAGFYLVNFRADGPSAAAMSWAVYRDTTDLYSRLSSGPIEFARMVTADANSYFGVNVANIDGAARTVDFVTLEVARMA